MVQAFDSRRKFVLGRLQAMPNVKCFDPRGAFYAFPNLKAYIGRRLPDGTEVENSVSLSAYMLHEYKLVVVPGTPFGAPNNIRLSFATSMEVLQEGLGRMQTALASLK